MWRSCCLFLARTAITLWVGAAILFVIVGVSEVVHSGFGSDIRDQLVVIRFPWFYRFGFTGIATSLICTLLISPGHDFSILVKGLVMGCLLAALLLMLAEYYLVYVKLVELVTPPGKPRTPEFMQYHHWSMYGNFGGLVLCACAMWGLNWPARPKA